MRHINRFATLGAVLALVGTACSGDKSDAASTTTVDKGWSPEKLTSVKGVPAADIEAALRKRLAGSPPAKTDDDQWGHAKRLHQQSRHNPPRLNPDGPHDARADPHPPPAP